MEPPTACHSTAVTIDER